MSKITSDGLTRSSTGLYPYDNSGRQRVNPNGAVFRFHSCKGPQKPSVELGNNGLGANQYVACI